MKEKSDQFEVSLESDHPLFVPVYHAFLESSLLDGKEKIIFIILKKFLKIGTDQGSVYPRLDTICKYAGMTKKTVIKIIKSLQEKGVLQIKQQGRNKPNLYVLYDNAWIWKAKNTEELQTYDDKIQELQMIEALTAKGYYISKEKVPDAEPTKEQNQALDNFCNVYEKKDIISKQKSQAERYRMQDIMELFRYEDLMIQHPEKQTDIDIVFDILYDTLNCTKETIRIGNEDKPVMVVIGKIMKLQPDDLIYSIIKFHEQTDRIQNVKGYLLTILYNSHEQQHLDLMNLGHYNGHF